MTIFEVPNLDCLSTEPADLSEVGRVFGLLCDYAHLKAKAMHQRKAGQVNAARANERLADARYVLLPDWAKW